MNRTIIGRITTLRGLRHQAETYIRQITDLGGLAPFAAVGLLLLFGKTYQDERRKMQAERVSVLKQEKIMYDRVERQLVRELIDEAKPRRGLRRFFGR